MTKFNNIIKRLSIIKSINQEWQQKNKSMGLETK